MKSKILIPILILGALAAFFSFKYIGADNNTGDKRKEIVLETVMSAISKTHYAPRAIDDTFSNRVYHKILDNLDYDKKFFTKQDIQTLSNYQYQIDDEIKVGSVEFFNKLNETFNKRIDQTEGYYKEILKTPFTFTGNDSIQLKGENLPYADEAQLKNRWYDYLKYRVLAKYVDLQNEQDKAKENKDKKDLKIKTNAELEADARASILKNQDSYFKRLRKINENERFAIYVNSITNSEDPHTDYFPPKDKQRFDEGMSGVFFGIGAQLKDDEGKIKIVAIITGSPSWKQGELKAGDEIVKVAQGSGEAVDIQGFDIDDAVQLIRGKKGTEVRLTVKKVDGSTKVIPIIRGEVQLDDVFAKSVVIDSKTGPIGYIYLPEFYADFQHIGGRRCAIDVKNEVEKLKKAGVKGIILDLRNNGGGSLNDVVDMGGLFIPSGPIVQVKSSGADAKTQSDRDNGAMLYDGPMAIMVNQNSASASEIMAAAMQDYKRAVIVGSPTYGKGTVQTIISLDGDSGDENPLSALTNSGSTAAPIGALKVTIQKFYRVNGGSTQLKGVIPDILLPDLYGSIDMGERANKSALKWDEIPAASYTPMPNPPNVEELRALSNKRVNANPIFGVISESAKLIKQREDDNFFPLNEIAYRKDLTEANAASKKLDDLQKKTNFLKVVNLKDDLSNINLDSTSIAKNQEWIKNIKKDVYISETVNIINDMSKMQSKVSNATGMK